MKHRIIAQIIFICLLTPFFLKGQDFIEALRYSNFTVLGTARTVGAGGAFGALGTDYSVLSTNPAGLGMYRSSEFVITPGVILADASSTLTNEPQNAPLDANRTAFNISNLGFVFADRPRASRWSTFNLAVGFNRIANFNQQFDYEGFSDGTITDFFLEIADNEGVGAFEASVAEQAEAIYDLDNDGVFETDYILTLEERPGVISLLKQQTVTRKGGINELVLSLAGNYNEQFIIGATLGFPIVSFRENKVYSEIDDATDQIFIFDDLEYRENLTTSGVGINLKLGVIFRVSQMLRVGMAVHTPTAYQLNEDLDIELDYNFTDQNQVTNGFGFAENSFDYGLRTPWRFIGSAAFLFQKRGFLSAELEYIDFPGAELRFDDNAGMEDIANGTIEEFLQSAINFRLGGEYAYQMFRFRAGVGFYASPYSENSDIGNTLSAGLGLRLQTFYFDLTYYRHYEITETYLPFATFTFGNSNQFIDNVFNRSQILLTLGYRF